MNATLTVHSLIQTGAIGLVITVLAMCVHFLMNLMGVHSSKSKLICASLLTVVLLTAKYLDYPITKVADKLTPLNIVHQNIDSAVKTIIWISLATLITSGLNYFIWEDNIKQTQQKSTPKLLVTILNIAIHTLFVMIIMSTVFNIDITNILAASGLGAFILGWSAKPTLTEFFAGIAIQMGGKLKKNAVVCIDHEEGILSDFNWRSISIIPISSTGRLLQQEKYIIPNSTLHSQSIRILRNPGEKKIRVEGSVFISPYSDLTICYQIIKKTLLEHTTEDSITLSVLTDNRSNFSITYTTMIPGLKNKLFFHQSFQASIIHRFLKNSVPHGQARLPWTINERSEQDLQSQIETQCSPEAPTNESIRDTLSQIEIFETLNDEELTNLINQSALEFFIVNEHIFHQRVKEDYSLHILLSGYADAYQINNGHYRVNVDKFKAGHYFGLQSFLLDVPHRISVLAKSPLWCIKIPRAVLSPLLEKYPQITESLGQLLAERKNESNQAIEEYKQANQAQNESTSEMFARKIKALFK